MNAPPPSSLTDTNALKSHHRRAIQRTSFTPSSAFLRQLAFNDVMDRIAAVNRSFTCSAVISPFPEDGRNLTSNPEHFPAGEFLNLPAKQFDFILHFLSLHWAEDPVGQLIQCRQALKPDGFLIACAWGGETLKSLRQSLLEAEATLFGGASPRVAPMAELRELGGLLQRANFALPVADKQEFRLAYNNLYALVRDLRDAAETNALLQRQRYFSSRKLFKLAEELYPKRDPVGRLIAEFDLITLSGWAPGDNQPQPLRPGSAMARLSAALGTEEHKLKS